jgi:hypothetical protein
LIGTERFGEASGRSNGPLRMKDQESVGGGETILEKEELEKGRSL